MSICFGVRGNALDLFRNYLSTRLQYTVVSKKKSDHVPFFPLHFQVLFFTTDFTLWLSIHINKSINFPMWGKKGLDPKSLI